MGALTRDMERLAAEVRRSKEGRRQHADRLRHDETERRRAAAEAAARRAAAVARLRAEVQGELAASRRRLESQSSRLRSELRDFADGLKSEVETLRSDVQQDLAGARAAWASCTDEAADVVARQVASLARLKIPRAEAADDLTTIPGIGPGMQDRLNRAGIRTFARLASTPLDELRVVLGELNRLAHVEDWVREARARLGGTPA